MHSAFVFLGGHALANQACFTLNEGCGEVAERPKALESSIFFLYQFE
jgi:hypothetical protein